MNRHQRRAQYAVPSRSKPYCPHWQRRDIAQSVARGRVKLENFIARGIQLNSKPNFMRRTAQAVKQALMK
jgi:hypothetical protein